MLSHAITIKKDDDYNIEDDIKYDKERGVVYHPKKGWGTIMFEDQFPSLGDYDFNDFVANYQVLFEVSKAKEKDEYESKYIVIGLCLKAVGGVFPYNPYLRLKKNKKQKHRKRYDESL
ncbi:MAG: LruC domain-containing protein [Bacteroides caccae]